MKKTALPLGLALALSVTLNVVLLRREPTAAPAPRPATASAGSPRPAPVEIDGDKILLREEVRLLRNQLAVAKTRLELERNVLGFPTNEPVEQPETRDYQALMSSREHLQRTLAWGDWPRADFTLEQNRRDLARHWLEFQGHAAYAYAVLTPDRGRSLGCVYLQPEDAAAEEPGPRLFFRVIEAELATDLDRHVLAAMLESFAGPHGPLARIVVPILERDTRGQSLAADLGLEREGERGGRVLWVHRRPERDPELR